MKGFDLINTSWGRPELEKETLRVYNICDGCRRCFNLCPSFNTLFDRIDVHESDTSQLTAQDFEQVEKECYPRPGGREQTERSPYLPVVSRITRPRTSRRPPFRFSRKTTWRWSSLSHNNAAGCHRSTLVIPRTWSKLRRQIFMLSSHGWMPDTTLSCQFRVVA